MQYFYRAHTPPEKVVALAGKYFLARGFESKAGAGDHARYSGPLGMVDLNVEIEGGHYARVNIATSDVGESELDKLAKRFLAELHHAEEPAHQVRGAY